VLNCRLHPYSLAPVVLILTMLAGSALPAQAQVESLPPDLSRGYEGAFFTDMNHGYVFGENTIISTADGGATWRLVRNDGDVGIHSLFFLDGQTFWVLTSPGELHRTTDGGLTFTSSSPEFLDHETGESAKLCGNLFFRSLNDGWSVCGRHVLITTDGGQQWTSYLLRRELGEPNRLWMFDGTEGIATNGFGPVLQTLDGGATWAAISNTPHLSPVSCAASGLCAGLSGPNGPVSTSSDRGVSWQDIQAPLQLSDRDRLQGIQATAASEVFLVGSDVGYSYDQDVRPYVGTRTPPPAFPPPKGLLLKWNGSGWTRLSYDEPQNLKSVDFLDADDGWLVAVGENLIYKTTDGGQNLTFVPDYFRQIAAQTPSPTPIEVPTPTP
jgi:photosystem II stability/assembly factor-like uncharacterized protein